MLKTTPLIYPKPLTEFLGLQKAETQDRPTTQHPGVPSEFYSDIFRVPFTSHTRCNRQVSCVLRCLNLGFAVIETVPIKSP